MKKLNLNKLCIGLLILYMFFLSFLIFTPIYLAVAIALVGVTGLKILKKEK